MTTLLYLIGTSVGPVIAGIFMQANQAFIRGISGSSFPAPQSYNLIFLTATLFSVVSIVLAATIKKKGPSVPKVVIKKAHPAILAGFIGDSSNIILRLSEQSLLFFRISKEAF